MYAIIEAGGKQVQVKEGESIRVEKIDAKPGDRVVFDHVLMVKEEGKPPQIGRPFVPKMAVETEVVEQGKDKKVLVFTFKRRKGYHKQQGHRQPFTALKVLKIGPSKN